MLTSSAVRRSDPIQQLYVQKIKEYSKLAASGKIDQAGVNAEIEAAKARLAPGGRKKILRTPKKYLLAPFLAQIFFSTPPPMRLRRHELFPQDRVRRRRPLRRRQVRLLTWPATTLFF